MCVLFLLWKTVTNLPPISYSLSKLGLSILKHIYHNLKSYHPHERKCPIFVFEDLGYSEYFIDIFLKFKFLFPFLTSKI